MVVHQEFQELDFQVAFGQVKSLDLSQVKGRAFLAVNNPGSYWVHFLDGKGTPWEWVWPTTFGWIMPLPLNHPAQLQVSAADLPAGYNADTTNQTAQATISVLSDFPRLSLGVQQLLSTKVTNAATLGWFDVKDSPYNAKGDGVNDDTQAIQSALSAASAAGGGTVYIPNGTYLVTSSLLISSNTLVFGSGWASLIQMSGPWTGSKGLFTFAIGGSNMVLRDIRIDGLRAGKANTSTARGVYVQNASHVRIERMHISDCSHAAILFDGGTDLVATSNYTFRGGDNGANGAVANGITSDINGAACSRVLIANNTIDQATDDGIAVQDGVTDAAVIGNNIDCTGALGQGIDIAGGIRVAVTGNVIRNVQTSKTGILVQQNLNLYNPSDVSVVGNSINCTGATSVGISVLGTVANPADRVSIVGNTIRGSGYAGITLSTECQNSVVQGNVITGCAGDGIQFTQGGAGNITNVLCTGNVVQGCTGWGIRLLEAAITGCKIAWNMLSGNVAGGISCTTAQRQTNEVAFNGPQDVAAVVVPDQGLALESVTSGRHRQAAYQLANLAVGPVFPGLGNFDALLFIVDRDSAAQAIYGINGGNNSATLLSSSGGVWSAAAGTAGDTNVYWSAANVRYEIENRRGAVRNYVVFLMVGD